MRLFLAAGAVVLACAGSAVAAPSAVTARSAGAPSAPPRDELRSFMCQKALDPPVRAVSVQAVMRPVTGTAKLLMRFDLMRRLNGHGPFRVVRGRLLGSWITPSDPTLGQRPGDVWIVNHPVVDLAAPATYRFRVAFRWLDAHGKQLSSAVQTSPNCYQPELRADLLVRSLSVAPLTGGQAAYTAVIADRGQTAAGPVEVDLAGAGPAQAATIPSVAARSSTHHRFVAPACTAGQPLTVTVDPAHLVDESSFANNVLAIPCPAASGS